MKILPHLLLTTDPECVKVRPTLFLVVLVLFVFVVVVVDGDDVYRRGTTRLFDYDTEASCCFVGDESTEHYATTS
jgi:hypothetical protein